VWPYWFRGLGCRSEEGAATGEEKMNESNPKERSLEAARDLPEVITVRSAIDRRRYCSSGGSAG
jgi:hypothetical protein